jgi:hypothetical protein
LVALVASIVASLVLAGATVALAHFTRVLGKATKQLGQIETARDDDRKRERKLRRVSLKMTLAEQLVAIPVADFMPTVAKQVGAQSYRGGPANTSAIGLRQLYELLDFGKDQVQKTDVDRILSVWDQLGIGSTYSTMEEEFAIVQRIKEQLNGDMFRWRNEIVELSALAAY